MSLSILSVTTTSHEETLKNVSLASFKAKLSFLFNENAQVSEHRIEVSVRKWLKADEYNYFLMDIIDESEQIENNKDGLLNFFFDGEKYFLIAGTDNTPSELCYHFSLAYLRLNPLHKIAIYDDCIFGLNEIEKIQADFGYVENWSGLIERPNKS